MIKIYAILIAIIVAISAAFWILFEAYQRKSDQLDRANNNINILTDTANYFKDKTGQQALRIGELQMTRNEMLNSKDSVIQKLVNENYNLGNKLRRTEQLLNIKTEIRDSAILVIKDTIIPRKMDTITKIASHSDGWLDLKMSLLKTTVELDYSYRDDLIVSIGWHREKKKFFLYNWLGFGRKVWDADIKSMNPNAKITYSKYIRMTGKRGR